MKKRSHKVLFTREGLDTYNHCIDYILNRFKDPFAADGLNAAIQRALDFLKDSPHACPVSDNPRLRSRGVRKIHLRGYRYKIFYHVVDEGIVYIDAVIHDLQDVDGVFG